VTRAKIVLLAAAGQTNAAIARTLQIAPNTARKWRKRYFEHGVGGLADRKRPGRPRTLPDVAVAEVKAIACELPAVRGVPISRWSLAELRTEVLASGLAEAVSTTTLGRWLAEDPLRPWRHRSWIFPRDPDFAAKAPAESLTCTSAPSTANPRETTTTWSRPTRRPASRPAAAAMPPCHRPRPAHACRARIRPWWGAGLPGRLGCPPRPAVRPLRATTGIARSAGWSTRS
jgi:transposase